MIIIETPAPPTRERLVLVPPDAVSRTASEPTLNVHTSAARDATPDDLARGGWVLDERRGITAELHATIDAFRRGIETRQEAVLRLADSHAEAIARAEKAERERDEKAAIAGNVLDFVVHTFDPGIRSPQAAWIRVLHEYGAAISRAEAAEGLLIQRETELRLAREDGAAVERQMREARSAADASFVRANRAEVSRGGALHRRAAMRAETAERERDEARDCGQVGVCAVTPGCQRHWAERARELLAERDTLRAERDEASKTLLEAGCGSVLPLAERVALLVDERAGLRADLRGAKEFARALEVELDTLRAELAAVSKTLLEAGCGSVLPLAERVAMLVDERAGLRGALHEAKEFARVLEVERGASREECSAQIARAVRAERERDPERILDDLDTLLAENARLRAVAEAARDACNIALNDAGPEAFATIADLRKALAALEAP